MNLFTEDKRKAYAVFGLDVGNVPTNKASAKPVVYISKELQEKFGEEQWIYNCAEYEQLKECLIQQILIAKGNGHDTDYRATGLDIRYTWHGDVEQFIKGNETDLKRMKRALQVFNEINSGDAA